MDENDVQNGYKVRVKFGPKPTQTIPHEWAERLLSRLAEGQPKRFGDLLREVVMEDLPQR